VRSLYEPISDEREAQQQIRETGARTVILDIEPVVAAWDTSRPVLDQGIARVLGWITAVPGVRVVCFATNSARKPSVMPVVPGVRVEYLSSARKPLRLSPYAHLPRPGVVVGDQIATDGVLAWRLGYMFVHFRPPSGSMPAGPAVLYRGGGFMRPLLFRRRSE
jgi:predicted HAD superfamily phosphohydrolase YqeG